MVEKLFRHVSLNGGDRSVKIESLEAAKTTKKTFRNYRMLVLGCIEADYGFLQVNNRYN